jgi:hypothetical protein
LIFENVVLEEMLDHSQDFHKYKENLQKMYETHDPHCTSFPNSYIFLRPHSSPSPRFLGTEHMSMIKLYDCIV